MDNAILNQFETAVDALINANPRNSSKGKDIKQWAEDNFHVSCSVSHVTDPRAIGNRVSEQMRYNSPIVVFVCDQSVNIDTLKGYIKDNTYKELSDVLIMNNKRPYSYCLLMHFKDSVFGNWISHTINVPVETNSNTIEIQERQIRGINYSSEYLRYLIALRAKPFMLLAGISGTGKSRIVRKLAQATTTQHYNNEEDRWKDNRPKNFELIQVKPNWHNSMDVVGFYSNISKKYEFTPFVKFIVKAWQDKDTPYFLCLDEMNLAPVEEYFAEFLSAIESRSTDENGEYITDPIIKPFKDFGVKEGKAMLIELLGDADPIDKNPLAIHLYEKGLTLPQNLMVMGTVNMDETTFSFSRKVLDRAMSVEMNEVDYDKFLSGESEQFPLLTDINALLVKRPQQASEVKDEIESKMVIDYLKAVNNLLDGTPFKLGYRAANEAMLYVAASREFAGENFSTNKALDEFTLMKILSRIEGDDNRLAVDENDQVVASIGREKITDAGEDRLNLLNCLRAIVRDYIGTETSTEKKINTMYRTLEREHFVSYWA